MINPHLHRLLLDAGLQVQPYASGRAVVRGRDVVGHVCEAPRWESDGPMLYLHPIRQPDRDAVAKVMLPLSPLPTHSQIRAAIQRIAKHPKE